MYLVAVVGDATNTGAADREGWAEDERVRVFYHHRHFFLPSLVLSSCVLCLLLVSHLMSAVESGKGALVWEGRSEVG